MFYLTEKFIEYLKKIFLFTLITFMYFSVLKSFVTKFFGKRILIIHVVTIHI